MLYGAQKIVVELFGNYSRIASEDKNKTIPGEESKY